MIDYFPYVQKLSKGQEGILDSLKKKLGEPRYVTFARWDVMVAEDGVPYILESNACPGAFIEIRQMWNLAPDASSKLEEACANYFEDKGIVGVNSVGEAGSISLPIEKNYGTSFVRGKTSKLYFHNGNHQFFFANKRGGSPRKFVDTIWLRVGKSIGRKVDYELARYKERNGNSVNIAPETFFPSLEFLRLSSNKYKLIRAVRKYAQLTPVVRRVGNAKKWDEEKIELMEDVRKRTLQAHPQSENDLEFVLKSCYGTQGKGIHHGTIYDLSKIKGEDLKFPLIINPKIIPGVYLGNPSANVDVGVFSVGLDLPDGFVKISAPGKLETNISAGGSIIPLHDGLKEKLKPHLQLAILSAEEHLREIYGGEKNG